jgi:hypothetical protein
MAGSCFLSQAEKNYAVIELELLAIQWATEKCRLYLAGANFTIVRPPTAPWCSQPEKFRRYQQCQNSKTYE